MIGVALCNGGGVYNLVNPYQQAQIRLPPPPTPYYPPHPYGYGQGGRIGIGGIILGLLGFFFISKMIIIIFGNLKFSFMYFFFFILRVAFKKLINND
jgi:hypothetical protein